jgi:hypothetical protein
MSANTTVIGARHFFPGQSFVRARILDCDGSLCRHRANQFQIVRFESSKGIESVCVESTVDARLSYEGRTNRRTYALRNDRIDTGKFLIRSRILRKQGYAIAHHLPGDCPADAQLPSMIVESLVTCAHGNGS